jgi:hypothetical protein
MLAIVWCDRPVASANRRSDTPAERAVLIASSRAAIAERACSALRAAVSVGSLISQRLDGGDHLTPRQSSPGRDAVDEQVEPVGALADVAGHRVLDVLWPVMGGVVAAGRCPHAVNILDGPGDVNMFDGRGAA